MNSYRTTIAGLLAGCGGALAILPGVPVWVNTVGKVCGCLGMAALGVFARDNKKSDESAGVDRTKDPGQ